MTVRDYLLVIRRRKWTVLMAVLLAPAVAVCVSLRQEHRYEAAAEVLLSRQSPGDLLGGNEASTQQAERIAATEANVARIPAIAARTLAAADVSELSPRDFLARSRVSPKGSTDILVFTVVASSPRLAARLASEYATQFLEYRRELDTSAFESARQAVARSLDRLELNDDASPGATGSGSSRLLSPLARSAVYASLLEREQELQVAEALLESRFLLLRPAENAELVSPRLMRNALLGLALGLLLGIGLAFLREGLDTRVRSAAEIGSRLGLPLLARIPGGLARGERPVMLESSYSPEAEAFRILRTNLELLGIDRGEQAVMVTSAFEGEGKSTTAANLALALARAGRHVVLADLNLRRPSLARLFSLGRRAGLADIVLGHVRLETAVVPIALPAQEGSELSGGNGRVRGHGTLEVLTAGSIRPEAGEFVGLRALRDLLDQLRRRADIVLVDAPPLLGVGDAIALTAKVDALLLVVSSKALRRPALAETRRVLDACPTTKLGFVTTGTGRELGYEEPGASVDGHSDDADWSVPAPPSAPLARTLS